MEQVQFYRVRTNEVRYPFQVPTCNRTSKLKTGSLLPAPCAWMDLLYLVKTSVTRFTSKEAAATCFLPSTGGRTVVWQTGGISSSFALLMVNQVTLPAS